MRDRFVLAFFVIWIATHDIHAAEGWKIGVARRDVTPTEPIWMAGYSARTAPSEGAVHPLWVRALAIEDEKGSTGVLVTLDVCGIDRELSLRIRHQIEADHALGSERVVLACSHTHCGPVLGHNLITMYPLDEPQRERITAYTRHLEAAVGDAVDEALKNRTEGTLSWGLGRANFGVNRRNNDQTRVPELREALALAGPNDPDVPVLVARTATGDLQAIVFGYACHGTTLSFQQLCNDYAGFAQVDLEAAYPQSMTFFWAGCGGDQNPLPRGTIELAKQHGGELAAAVRSVVDGGGTKEISGALRCAYGESPLTFDTLPEKSHWEATAQSDNVYEANRAKALLARIDADGPLSPTYPYPVAAWQLGDGPLWIFLGGEVVVDYALRLKRNLSNERTWIAAYCNDVMAYIPTRRVWDEGGYEGGGAMVYYAQPTRWSESVESEVIAAVKTVLKNLGSATP